MRRVHTIHMLRPIISFGALSALVAVIALWGIGREVWVTRVLENMPQGDIIALSRFSIAAFENTRFTVQALTFITLASVVYLTREMTRGISSTLISVRI